MRKNSCATAPSNQAHSAEGQSRSRSQAREKEWASDEHFTVDGSLLEAWASVKSFQQLYPSSGESRCFLFSTFN
jgi:hypothetical protein